MRCNDRDNTKRLLDLISLCALQKSMNGFSTLLKKPVLKR